MRVYLSLSINIFPVATGRIHQFLAGQLTGQKKEIESLKKKYLKNYRIFFILKKLEHYRENAKKIWAFTCSR
jgi:hypothetical protein